MLRYLGYGLESSDLDLAPAFVALKDNSLQVLSFHDCFQYCVSLLCLVVRRNLHSTPWTLEIAISSDPDQVNVEQLDCLHKGSLLSPNNKYPSRYLNDL